MNTTTAKAYRATTAPRLNVRTAPQIAKPKLTVVRAKRQPLRYELSREAIKAAAYALVGLIIILMLQLVLSTLTASGVYEISRLKHEAKELAIEADIIQAHIYDLESPQNLTNEAHALGMTQAETPAYLNLSTGEVTGVPKPAKGEVMVSNLVPNSAFNGIN